MAIAPGARFGVYVVAESIGAGGMGEVYRATDPYLKRDVAIKLLPATFAGDPARVARFQREAETLAGLNHPNIAQVYGLERDEESIAFVMELVEGPTLADRIAEGPIPHAEALGIALQLAAALEAAHGRGVVHRDVKPANLKVRPDGVVKVLDFGLATAPEPSIDSRRSPQRAAGAPALTEVGTLLGTAAYMSPEQARGRPVDQRADIWAFGCVLYEMLTGRPVFDGQIATMLEREPDMTLLPKALPPMIARTIELCLQKDLARRLADIRDVKLALQGSFDHDADTTPRAPTSKRSVLISAVLIAGAILVGAYAWTSRRDPPVPATVARFVITTPASAPLSRLNGNDIIISPDGKRLAYLAYGEGPQGTVRAGETSAVALYVRDLDGLEARLLPGTRVEDPGIRTPNPFFSPDGKSLGFWAPGRGVLRVSVDGGEPVKLVDDPETAFVGAAWATDDTIIYSSGYQLHRVSAGGGGTPTALTPPPATAGPTGPFIGAPLLLPGERALLFTIIDGNAARIAVLDLETREQKILIEDGSNAFYAPTGHVLFARGTTVMAASFDLSELALVAEPVAVLQGVRHPVVLSAADYALSATGTLIYVPDDSSRFLNVGRNAAMVWVDRNGRVTEQAVRELVANPSAPRLSYAGDRLALMTGSGRDADIWIYDLSGKPSVRLVERGHNADPVWSRDDREIAFQSGPALGGDAAGPRPVVAAAVIRSDGSELTPRLLPRESVIPTPREWSAAGELLVVAQRNGGTDILATPATPDGEFREVVATEYDEMAPALSRDGRWLAYVSNRTGSFEVWVNGYPEGPSIRLSQDGGYSPKWAADGRQIFYIQGSTMMAAPVENGDKFSVGPATALFDIEGEYLLLPRPEFQFYDVSADGRFLMIQPRRPAEPEAPSIPLNSIVVIQNWTEELKELVPTN